MSKTSTDYLSNRLPGPDRNFLSERNTSPLWMPGKTVDYAHLVLPDSNKSHVVSYPNSQGQPVEEFRVTQASNCIAVNYSDPRNGKRPGERGFVVIDGGKSCKPSLQDGFGVNAHQFIELAKKWLGDIELRVIPSRVAQRDNKSLVDVASVVPVGAEWAKLAWDLIHGATDANQLLTSYNPKIVFYLVPGLRDIFDGEQCTMFERCDGGVLRIYTNSTYMGLAMSKKPIFVALSHLLQQSGGIMCHATMAILEGSSCRKGYIYHAASGHGKTEFRFVREGKIALGKLGDDRLMTLFYPPDQRPAIICAGDDGVIIPDLKNTNGLGYAENSEKGGLFDRPSSSFKEGDLPENDELLRNAEGDPHRQLVLNMRAVPGNPLKTHEREFDTGGKLHSNPRHTYTWEDLGNLQLPKDQRVSFTTEPITFNTSIFGMGVTPKTAVASWINRLPLCTAYTMMLAGVCQSKSVSVTESGQASVTGLKLDRFGTMESFTINEAVDNANRLWEYYKHLHKVEHYVVPIGNVGPEIVAKDNEAELLARDFLFQLETGNASTEWVPHPWPFLGMIPSNAYFFGQRIPAEYSDPSMQFKTRSAFKEACYQVHSLIRGGLEDISCHERLHPEAKRALERALSAPLYVQSAAERADLYDSLNRPPVVYGVK